MIKELRYNGWLKVYNITDTNKNGTTVNREVMSRSSGNHSDDSVAGILYDPKKEKFYLVSQYRAGSSNEDRYLIEVVAGTLDVGEDPFQCFARESMEEVGFKCDEVRSYGTFYTSPGGTTERIHVFYGIGEKVSEGGGLEEENEDIEVLELSYEQLEKLISEGSIKDLKTQFLLNIVMSNKGINKN